MTPAGMSADMGTMAEGTLAVTARDQEDDRRRRIETIVGMIAGRWGRVSPDGVERCARRVGFECLWEQGADGKRTLSIAGQGVLIDVEFAGEDVHHVLLTFLHRGDEAGRAAPDGAEVLRQDLRGTGPGYVMLDRFVTNLARLATMDRLGVGGVSCFDAVDGVGGCLRRVFAWELQQMQQDRTARDDRLDAETAVMCTGSGRPQMHAQGRMGLTLQYWKERRLVGVGRPGAAVAMEVDRRAATPRRQRDPAVYSALIDCEACSSDLYPPIRVSSAWVADAVGKPPDDLNPSSAFPHDSLIDWQEPLPTPMSSDGNATGNANATGAEEDAMSVDGVALLSAGKLPNVRFVARLDPPVIVPLAVAIAIYDSVGAPIPQESMNPTTYETLLFAGANGITTITAPSPTNLAYAPTQSRPTHTVERSITTYNDGGYAITSRHKYTLFTPTKSFARLIDNIPFSHPRQILAILPFLRQWALLGNILRRTFIPPTPPPPPRPSTTNDRKKKHRTDPKQDPVPASTKNQASSSSSLTSLSLSSLTLDEELAAFLSPTPVIAENDDDDVSSSLPPPPPPPLAVDISLSLIPAPPRLTCVFEVAGKLHSIIFGVGENGEVVVMNDDEEGEEGNENEEDDGGIRRMKEEKEEDSEGKEDTWME
jgi:hypothetical protein